MEQPKLDRKANLNVLDFWKGNRFRYPELAAMACDISCIPITTVASEAAFSAGGRVLNKYRTTLLPENAETLICARDWLYGEKGISFNVFLAFNKDWLCYFTPAGSVIRSLGYCIITMLELRPQHSIKCCRVMNFKSEI